MSRLKRLLHLNQSDLTEVWQYDALYQLGTKINEMAPHLFTNSIPHADSPDLCYQEIIKIFKSIREPIDNWNTCTLKHLYDKMHTQPPESEYWLSTLSCGRRTSRDFSQTEKEKLSGALLKEHTNGQAG